MASEYGYSCVINYSDYKYPADITFTIDSESCVFKSESAEEVIPIKQMLFKELVLKIEGCYT